jgi:hypothetical protein
MTGHMIFEYDGPLEFAVIQESLLKYCEACEIRTVHLVEEPALRMEQVAAKTGIIGFGSCGEYLV